MIIVVPQGQVLDERVSAAGVAGLDRVPQGPRAVDAADGIPLAILGHADDSQADDLDRLFDILESRLEPGLAERSPLSRLPGVGLVGDRLRIGVIEHVEGGKGVGWLVRNFYHTSRPGILGSDIPPQAAVGVPKFPTKN